MSTLREKIQVMDAYERGEAVEYRLLDGETWKTPIDKPMWNWENANYRVKPKVTLCSNVRMDLEKVDGQPFATRYTVTCDCGFVDRTTCRHCADARYEEHALVAKVNRKPTHLRPWTAGEAVGKVVRHKSTPDFFYVITRADMYGCYLDAAEYPTPYIALLNDYQQPSGDPCGVEE
jgi:hypothetical protein